MTGFDAELYLRLAAERHLAAGPDPERSHEVSPLTAAGQALVAAGAIDDAALVAVLEDYLLASALRGDAMSVHSLATEDDDEPSPPAAVEPLSPARVVSCDRELELASGTLHVSHVTLARDATTLAVVLRLAGSARRRRGRGSTMRAGPPTVSLTDDRGTRAMAHFSGGGSDSQWDGQLYAEPGLHPDTAYIEVDGRRIDLEGQVKPAEVWLEDLPSLDPALRHLWQCVTPEGHMHESPVVEPAIDALLAAGAVSADEPALADVRAVAVAMTHGAMYGAPASSAKKLPEPWRSVLRGSSRRGPVGTLAVSAATPVFDGFAVAVSAIQSDESGWEAEVAVAPDLEMFSPFAAPRARSRRLTWWAADDRGHQFLGSIGNWGSGGGNIHFGAALDRKAAYIDLLPTAATQRAVIRVPLEWV